MIQEIKNRLLEDDDIIEDILYELGFTGIKKLGNEIRCARPDGDNETSVRIKLSPSLYTNIYTRSDFESKYDINDFISLISFVTNKGFKDTVDYLSGKVGISEEFSYSTPEILKVLNKLNREPVCIKENSYDTELISNYPSHIVDEWIEEGIPPYVQSIYDVRIDTERKRWLLPSYDEKENLITLQGRTYIDNYKELKIPKYIYYKLCGNKVNNTNLYGLNIAYESIMKKKEVILFEGAKSVMKAYDWGYTNAVALQGANISDMQVNKLLSLGANVVLALDKDKNYKDITIELDKLKYYLNCYYIYDKGMLNEKESPVDRGLDVFESLYTMRKKYG